MKDLITTTKIIQGRSSLLEKAGPACTGGNKGMKILVTLALLLLLQWSYSQKKHSDTTGRKYYFSVAGNDNNDGSLSHPFRSIAKFNSLRLEAGDKIYFKSGETFNGTMLIDSSKYGRTKKDILIGSYIDYGESTHTQFPPAIINAGDSSALTISNSSYITIANLHFKGNGRKDGNTNNGVIVNHAKNIIIGGLDISGFQKSGLLIYSSSDILCERVYAHDNGSAGITVDGPYAKKESNYNIYIGNCMAENNPGDPTNFNNHSGNGIVVANCRRVIIERCTATNNGWDMPRIGNGPVGIWAFEADSVTIEHCLSYRNKTSIGGADGGGFDLDGGVTNSMVQYNLSYENQGAGYSIFQYLYASPWYNNVYRFNISIDDGLVSDARAGVHIWNSSRDSMQFYNCLFYNNTIYNSKGSAISYSELSEHKNFSFFNNIFVGQDSIIKGIRGADIFLGNDWWSLSKKFNIENTYDFNKWVAQTGLEIVAGKIAGLNVDPDFKSPGKIDVLSAEKLSGFSDYYPQNALLKKNGINLKTQFHMDIGKEDFNSRRPMAKMIGACIALR